MIFYLVPLMRMDRLTFLDNYGKRNGQDTEIFG